jgi:hypothetical protein
MHDLSSPLLNVVQAGGPGCNPFRISHPCYSQISISQGALWFVCTSSLSLVVGMLSIFGARFAILVFQSPHITVVSCYGKHPIVSSMRLLAIASSIPRFYWLMIGGRYIFPIHILSPPCIWRHIPCVYSFPMYLITFMPFLTSMAMPPRFPDFLRSSQT